MFDFIQQYAVAQSGNMVPLRYTNWCALFLLGAAVGKHVYVDHQHYILRANNYFVLVGRPASKKTTAMRAAKRVFRKAFPNATLGAAIMSREKIVETLCHEEYHRFYPDSYPGNKPGLKRIYTPCTFFINELKNFISVDIVRMVEFLTDIYDEDEVFDSATVKHGLQPVIEPCINILSCVTPEWIIDKFKADIISGGIARRLIFIYEIKRPPRITFAHKSMEACAAEAWCINHLQKISQITGEFVWEPAAKAYLDEWFVNLPDQDDKIFESFYEAKDGLVTKIAMLLAMARPEPKLVITELLIRLAVEFLEDIEPNLPYLTVGLGQNKLAVPMQRLMQILKDNNGIMPEYIWHRLAGRDLNEAEYMDCKNFLRRTRQLHEESLDGVLHVMTWQRKRDLEKVNSATSPQPSPSPSQPK